MQGRTHFARSGASHPAGTWWISFGGSQSFESFEKPETTHSPAPRPEGPLKQPTDGKVRDCGIPEDDFPPFIDMGNRHRGERMHRRGQRISDKANSPAPVWGTSLRKDRSFRVFSSSECPYPAQNRRHRFGHRRVQEKRPRTLCGGPR